MEHELVAEKYGGQTVTVEVSAKKRTGLDTLLEMILLVSDMLELKANPDKPAVGVIIEAELSRGKGAVATALVENGTLREGDFIVAGSKCGRGSKLPVPLHAEPCRASFSPSRRHPRTRRDRVRDPRRGKTGGRPH